MGSHLESGACDAATNPDDFVSALLNKLRLSTYVKAFKEAGWSSSSDLNDLIELHTNNAERATDNASDLSELCQHRGGIVNRITREWQRLQEQYV